MESADTGWDKKFGILGFVLQKSFFLDLLFVQIKYIV
jgi:hypothetical protein